MLNNTEKDLLKKIKCNNRINQGFEKTKITKNKKKYCRKKYKLKNCDKTNEE